ncbi:MAG: hypothetical protein GX066_06795 [Clostridiaceae bacterium]|nr:hypothetical protein [Clostridiaceae bacterium]
MFGGELTHYIYIHPTFFIIIPIAIITKSVKEIVILYGIIIIHEFFHLIVMLHYKIEIEQVKIMPFGITIKIKNNLIEKPEHEIMVALAGPLSNALLAFAAYLVKVYCLYRTDDITFFIFGNIVIGTFNLMPVLPLDGGRILKAVLTLKWGYVKAFYFVMKLTRCMSFIFFIIGIYVFYITRFNFSLLLIGTFLIFNGVYEQQNNRIILMKEIIYYKQKLIKEGLWQAKNMVVISDYPAHKLLKNFSYNYFYLVTVIDNKMNILGTLTEMQIIDGLIRLGTNVSVEEIINDNFHTS